MALQLVAGLQAAADAGILHRDVKPSNCFVDADGVIKIGDFGISRSVRPTRGHRALDAQPAGGDADLRLARAVARRRPRRPRRHLQPRRDALRAGHRPAAVHGARPDVAADGGGQRRRPTPPHAVVPAVPRGLSRVILRCLAKKPEDRYAELRRAGRGARAVRDRRHRRRPHSAGASSPARSTHVALGLLNAPITLTLIGPMLAGPDWRLTAMHMAAVASRS